MRRITDAQVLLDGRVVGTLAMLEGCAAFEYSDSWLADGFSVSPLSLPLKKGVRVPGFRPFEGLFGIFSDSLPDGWGRLLLDRFLRKMGENPDALNPVERLCIVGSTGMGALEYRPDIDIASAEAMADLDVLARECAKVLRDEDSDDLDRMFRMGGSSGGARPKVLMELDGEPWIVKFRSSIDPVGVGKMEYEYACCARECGIEVPEVRLLPSEECSGFFAVKRFDRVRGKDGRIRRIHMATASALLETSHRLPNLDYEQLMKLTSILTNGDAGELRKLFRLMCFNVFAHNRDDHSKNFTFLYDQNTGRWQLSPAYDLTFSNSIGGQHATTVAGNGENPGLPEILRVAASADLDEGWAADAARKIQYTVKEMLNPR